MPGTIHTIAARPVTGQGFVWSEKMGGGFDPGAQLTSLAASSLSGLTQNRVPFGTSAGGLQDSANLTFDGTTLTLGGPVAASSFVGPAVGAAYSYAIAGRSDLTFPVVTYRPTTATKACAFDLMPNGAPADTAGVGVCWFDVCSTDYQADVNNGEGIRIAKKASGIGYLSVFKTGTGTQRNLALQPGAEANVLVGLAAEDGTSKLLQIGGFVSQSSGNDGSAIIGRGSVGSFVASNTFGLAHTTYANVTSFALCQVSAGDTYVNAHTGRSLFLQIANSTKATLTSSALTIAAGVPATVSDTTASSSTTTGALIVSGGAGIGGKLYTGDNITMNAGNTESRLTLGTQSSAGAYSIAVLNQGSTHFAWLFGAQYTQSETFEIIPSTAAGGSTFSSAAFSVTQLGSTVLGKQAALATTATDGFVYLPTCAGTPTGVPTSFAGKVAALYDTTGNKLWVYNGAWKSVTLA